jgi:Ca2+-binding RTX toxin-like protein
MDAHLCPDPVAAGPVPPPGELEGGGDLVERLRDGVEQDSGAVLASGDMAEGPDGTYSASVPPLRPAVGYATVAIVIDCPDGSAEGVDFTIYIDPSGTIFDTDGEPIEGATATLYRSDFPEGPFQIVPDGSAIMSPANRVNPMLTGADGRFGWDTIAGFYIAEASAPGCVNPDGTGDTVETEVLPVPPPQLDLVLTLDCETEPPPPADPLTLLAIELNGIAFPGEQLDLTAEFSGGVQPYSTTVDWGDGGACPGDGTCFVDPMQDVMPGIVDADYTYGESGVFTVTVTITDAVGTSVSASVDTAACTIIGTPGRDVLRGTDGDDVMCGLGGNDRMFGLGGNDIMFGGSGRDWMDGGDGNDELLAGSENDQLFGRDGDDKLLGGRGLDIIRGGDGNDYINGRLGDDRAFGENGEDLLVGERGRDRLYGGNDDDELRGRRGADTLDGQRGNDLVLGGQGRDTVRGGDGADELFGGTGADNLYGGRGDDFMDGGDSVDRCRDTSGFNLVANCELS